MIGCNNRRKNLIRYEVFKNSLLHKNYVINLFDETTELMSELKMPKSYCRRWKENKWQLAANLGISR
jgi:hypothetical protein